MNEPKMTKRTFAPMLWINLLFGMGVFDLKPNLFNKVYEYVYTAVFLILLNGVMISLWSSFEIVLKIQVFEGSEIMFSATLVSQVVVIDIVIIVSRLNSQKLRRILRLVESYDRKMENIGLPSRNHTLFVYQIKIILLYGIPILSYFVIKYMNVYEELTTLSTIRKLSLTLVQTIFSYSVCVSDISFCIWIKYFRIKFQQMNQTMRGILTTTPDSPQHKRVLGMQYDFKNKTSTSFRSAPTRGGNANVHVIRTIKQRHLELIKIARMINSSYGIQIVVLMTTSFVFIIGILYMSYRTLWMNLETHIFLYQIIPFFYYILFYSWRIAYENHVCAETSAEAAEIGDIICELYEPSVGKEFRMEIQDFTLQLIQNPLVFTGCGFFDLGHSFIQETVGSITTYLVILIQVGDMSIEFSDTVNNYNTENGTPLWEVDTI